MGEDPASEVYVNAKVRKCAELGIHSEKVVLSKDASQDEVLVTVKRLNEDASIHGILVQSPPPSQIDEEAIVRAIDPAKDVDGFHPENVAKLALEDSSGFVPCTPAGCMRLLEASRCGDGWCRCGRRGAEHDRWVSRWRLLLMARGSDATVTVAHSRTKDLAAVCRRADIIVAAVGIPEFIRAGLCEGREQRSSTWASTGWKIRSAKRGYRLCGDVAYDEVSEKAWGNHSGAGWSGADDDCDCLMKNTIKAARAIG